LTTDGDIHSAAVEVLTNMPGTGSAGANPIMEPAIIVSRVSSLKGNFQEVSALEAIEKSPK
jgi:hypothetical protein